MKILVTHYYSKKNKGDAAINSVLISQLKRAYPNSQITISNSDAFAKRDRFEGVKFVSSFLYESLYATKSPIMRIARVVYVIVASSLWTLTKRDFLLSNHLRDYMHALHRADLVVATGGGYLYARKNIREDVVFTLQLLPIIVAKILQKPVAMYAQSIGPFVSGSEKFLAKNIFNKVDVLMTRERITDSILAKLDVTDPVIIPSTDAAFSFVSPYKATMEKILISKGIQRSRTRVGITVKKCYRDDRQNDYEKNIAIFTEFLVKKYNAQVIFVPQCTSTLHNDDDRVVASRIVHRIRNKKGIFVLVDEFDHQQTKSIFENMDFVLATRMHSAIFALTGYVPTMTIAYEHKTLGVMRELKLEKMCIALEDVSSEKLEEIFDQLYNNKHKYISTLKERIAKFIKIADESVDTMKLAWDKSLSHQKNYFNQPVVIRP